MKWDGMNFRRSRKIAFIDPREGDCYVSGKEIQKPYVVFVRYRDADPPDEEGFWHPETAKKIIPLKYHSLTNLAFGPWKEIKHDDGFVTVWECHAYLAYDGLCYTHLIRQYNKPKVLDLNDS